mgnify:CR=1 FL=1
MTEKRDYKSTTYEIEERYFSPFAAKSKDTRGRAVPIEESPMRTEYQRDRDRIIHCKAFRRLKHKTQVFLAPEGDHYRTRLTHTLEVSQIARSISRALWLNEDLTEAIALAHDLGHTPYGHAGERALGSFTHFCHNVQSLRMVDVLEYDGKGMNLTYEVRDGILNHTSRGNACTLEGHVVAWSDRIAYINHDIDDAIRAGILREADLPDTTHRVLGANHSARIETLVTDMVRTSAETGDIAMSPEVWDAMMELRAFLFENVYTAPSVMAEVEKAKHLLADLFDYYAAHIDEVPEDYRAISEGDDLRAVTDYIAGMTDRYATATYQRLFIPHALSY